LRNEKRKAIAKGKLVVKENITAEQGQKRHDELRGRNTADADALPRIVTKSGQTWYK
jgi:hypothetical protein